MPHDNTWNPDIHTVFTHSETRSWKKVWTISAQSAARFPRRPPSRAATPEQQRSALAPLFVEQAAPHFARKSADGFVPVERTSRILKHWHVDNIFVRAGRKLSETSGPLAENKSTETAGLTRVSSPSKTDACRRCRQHLGCDTGGFEDFDCDVEKTERNGEKRFKQFARVEKSLPLIGVSMQRPHEEALHLLLVLRSKAAKADSFQESPSGTRKAGPSSGIVLRRQAVGVRAMGPPSGDSLHDALQGFDATRRRRSSSAETTAIALRPEKPARHIHEHRSFQSSLRTTIHAHGKATGNLCDGGTRRRLVRVLYTENCEDLLVSPPQAPDKLRASRPLVVFGKTADRSEATSHPRRGPGCQRRDLRHPRW